MLFSTARKHCRSAKCAYNEALKLSKSLDPKTTFTPDQSQAINTAFHNFSQSQVALNHYIGKSRFKKLICFLFGRPTASKVAHLMKAITPFQQTVKAKALLRGAITRMKIQKAIASAQADYDKPLTEAEYRFIGTRDFGLRCSPKGEREFIDGIFQGDAISLSGRPHAWSETDLQKDEHLIPEYVKKFQLMTCPNHEIKTYEDQVQKFIGMAFWIASELKYINPNPTVASIQTVLSERKKRLRFLLGNFFGASMPYDITNYNQLGKCGSHERFKSPREKGRQIKSFEINQEVSDLCNQLTTISPDTPFEEQIARIDKMRNQIGSAIWKQVRFEIRKIYLLKEIDVKSST